MRVLLLPVLFFVFVDVIFGGLEKEEALNQCISELHVDAELKEYFKTRGELPENAHKNATCVFFCVAKKMNWSDDKATIDKEKILEFVGNKYPALEKEKYEAVVTRCAERSETDSCEKWYEFTKCQLKEYLEHMKKMAETS